jgi:hypothetical protein
MCENPVREAHSQVRLLRACTGINELSRLTANHNTFRHAYLMYNIPRSERNVGIDVQIAVCTDAVAGNVVLFPISGPHHSGRVPSVLMITRHDRGTIKNLGNPNVVDAVSTRPIRVEPRIGDRAADGVGNAAALARYRICTGGSDRVPILQDLFIYPGPSLWLEHGHKLVLVGLHHGVPLRDKACQGGNLIGFYSSFLSFVEVIDGLLEIRTELPSGVDDRPIFVV